MSDDNVNDVSSKLAEPLGLPTVDEQSERSERSEQPPKVVDTEIANETLRITNDKEGTKKQKSTAKKLITYSEDAKKRMSKKKYDEDKDNEEPKQEQVEQVEEPKVEQPQSSFNVNAITILGALLAIGGLYFAYKADQREMVQVEEDTPSEEKAPVKKGKSGSNIKTL